MPYYSPKRSLRESLSCSVLFYRHLADTLWRLLRSRPFADGLARCKVALPNIIQRKAHA
jgi:hypothetical protein